MIKSKALRPFLWGTATSAHQVEGDNRNNDWWNWETQGKVREPSGIACDHYRRYQEDFNIAAELGHSAHRFSIEWSRLQPAEDSWNEEEFSHYEKVLRALQSRNLEPVVTLHHFTNPLWFSKMGGWLHPDAVELFARYVQKAVERFGKHVKFWITINEPLVYVYFGYLAGEWPPGHRSFSESRKLFKILLHAHIRAYGLIHEYYRNQLASEVFVSIAKHISSFAPCRPEAFADRAAMNLRGRFFNHLFFEALQSGFLFFPGVFCEFLPARSTLDFLGVNYYMRDFIRFSGFSALEPFGNACDKIHHLSEIEERNMMGWDIYPEGFYQCLLELKRYRLPVIITENGTCTEDDHQRSRFIVNHIRAAQRAIQQGVTIAGYFYWSLLDNFEWAHGFDPHFGIVGVDYKTQQRKIRPSAQVLSECCRKLSGQ